MTWLLSLLFPYPGTERPFAGATSHAHRNNGHSLSLQSIQTMQRLKFLILLFGVIFLASALYFVSYQVQLPVPLIKEVTGTEEKYFYQIHSWQGKSAQSGGNLRIQMYNVTLGLESSSFNRDWYTRTPAVVWTRNSKTGRCVVGCSMKYVNFILQPTKASVCWYITNKKS